VPASAPGAGTAGELSSLDLLQADACTTCGRCNAVCPALAAGKPLAPREIVLGIRAGLDGGLQVPLARFIADEALWSCTTCAACNEACPVGIDVYDKIVALRRGRVEAGQLPPAAEELFESVGGRWNPYKRAHDDRMSWAIGLSVPTAAADEPVEVLYWIGCAAAFDRDAQAVAQAMIKILNHLSIPYRVLGGDERCTGDAARRMGEEGLFQELARANLETFRRHRVRTILTHCPHCFNAFTNEYAHVQSGLAAADNWRVVHHSQFLDELIASGKAGRLTGARALTTFHDPCYLGRGNGVFAAPRRVLAAVPETKLVEMPRSQMQSFCCGAGGGAMWLDVAGRDRVENLRFREAAATGAHTIVTGCPFCKTMLDAGRQAETNPAGGRRVADLAEVLAEAMGL
jgi:Fe-S oxidoreductase